MHSSTITSKGQTTLPRSVRQALGVVPGDRVRYVILEDREVRILPIRRLSQLFGTLQRERPPVTLQDMERAVAEGANDQ